jgi:hypothetical protein
MLDKGAFRWNIYTMITKKSFTATFVAPLGMVSRVSGKRVTVKAIVADDRAHAVRIAHRMGLGAPVSVRPMPEAKPLSREDRFARLRAEGGANLFATGGGWPGDGSGADDLADFNQLEGGDM